MASMIVNARMYLQALLYVSCTYTYIFTFYHRPEYRQAAQLKQLIVPSPNKVFQQQHSRQQEQERSKQQAAGVVCQFAFTQHFTAALKSSTSFFGFPFRLSLLYDARLVARLVEISYDVGDFFSEAVFIS